MAGCGTAESPSSDDTAQEAQAVHVYEVRGVIRQLPSAEDPSKQLLILHEPIPDWVNDEGFETGMPGMTMPFTPAPEVDLSALAPGDTVLFTFRVDWNNAPRMQLTAIEQVALPEPVTSQD